MKLSTRLIFTINLLVAVFFFLIGATAAYCSNSPIHIEANRMTSVEKSNSVIFTGDVDAKQGDVRIRSDKMTVFYTSKDQKVKKGEKNPTQQVEKMICIGNVEITRAEWMGTAKKMIYLARKRQVILTDHAKAWQGQNMVSGDKIIYYLDEGRSEVIGGTSTTVGKKGSGKKKPSRVNMTILQN